MDSTKHLDDMEISKTDEEELLESPNKKQEKMDKSQIHKAIVKPAKLVTNANVLATVPSKTASAHQSTTSQAKSTTKPKQKRQMLRIKTQVP